MKKLINARGRLLDLSTPAVMGILNLTPDSFFDGGVNQGVDAALAQAERMLSEGAAIIDLGAQSTRPGAYRLRIEEEWQRLETPLKALINHFPEAIFSIDTFYATIAEQAVDAGCGIVNDISGGTLDDAMFATVARLQVPYILMHIQGTPETMQLQPTYSNVVTEVFDNLQERIVQLRQLGLNDIIVDPGFGFGKSLEHNYDLLRSLRYFTELDVPVLAGLSRKSMINKVLGISASEALNGTTVLNLLALQGGASILRVHDVKEAVQTVKLFDYYKKA